MSSSSSSCLPLWSIFIFIFIILLFIFSCGYYSSINFRSIVRISSLLVSAPTPVSPQLIISTHGIQQRSSYCPHSISTHQLISNQDIICSMISYLTLSVIVIYFLPYIFCQWSFCSMRLLFFWLLSVGHILHVSTHWWLLINNLCINIISYYLCNILTIHIYVLLLFIHYL